MLIVALRETGARGRAAQSFLYDRKRCVFRGRNQLGWSRWSMERVERTA